MTRIAVLQMQSGIDPHVNCTTIEEAAKTAAEKGAAVLFTPEMAILLDRKRDRASLWVETDGPDRVADRLSKAAVKHNIDIALGSMPVPTQEGRWANRAMYFSADARDASAPVMYDKIHMFDVELSTGESWRESKTYAPGRDVVTIEQTPLGRLGLAICYDMRFPALFEAFGARKCDVISNPAAFTVPTGKAHWHVLLRARAIEASAFVVAAAQVGDHADGRSTYGHSLVIDPWGEVLLDLGGEGPQLGFCEIDPERIKDVRLQVPSLANRREIAK